MWEHVNFRLSHIDCVQFEMISAVVIFIAADDSVVTIEDDTGEASMMKMMGFSDFGSTKASLRDVLSVSFESDG